MKQERTPKAIELENERLRAQLRKANAKIVDLEKENEDLHDYVRDLQGQLRIFRGY